MLTQALVLSIQIIGIKICFSEGMIMGWFMIGTANLLDKIFGLKVSKYIQKPLWDCFVCMASFWVIILSWSFDIKMILLVCGLNLIIDKIIPDASETYWPGVDKVPRLSDLSQ